MALLDDAANPHLRKVGNSARNQGYKADPCCSSVPISLRLSHSQTLLARSPNGKDRESMLVLSKSSENLVLLLQIRQKMLQLMQELEL
jgi:hypothetical protein